MESQNDINAFFEEIRNAPLSQEMIGMILNRLNDAEQMISTADAEENVIEDPFPAPPADPAPDENVAFPEPESEVPIEQYSVSPDSGDDIPPDDEVRDSFRQVGAMPVNEFEAQAMYPISSPTQAVEPIAVEEEEPEQETGIIQHPPYLVTNPQNCKKCEEQKKTVSELQQNLSELEQKFEELKRAKVADQKVIEFAKHCNGEGLSEIDDSDLSELESKLKNSLEKIALEKETVFFRLVVKSQKEI